MFAVSWLCAVTCLSTPSFSRDFLRWQKQQKVDSKICKVLSLFSSSFFPLEFGLPVVLHVYFLIRSLSFLFNLYKFVLPLFFMLFFSEFKCKFDLADLDEGKYLKFLCEIKSNFECCRSHI